MNNNDTTNDLLNRLESLDPLASEPTPAGWTRRNWVQREVVAFSGLSDDAPQPRTLGKETP